MQFNHAHDRVSNLDKASAMFITCSVLDFHVHPKRFKVIYSHCANTSEATVNKSDQFLR